MSKSKKPSRTVTSQFPGSTQQTGLSQGTSEGSNQTYKKLMIPRMKCSLKVVMTFDI